LGIEVPKKIAVLNNTRNPEGLDRARDLRKGMSTSERVLWELSRKDRLGFRFRRQVRVGPYCLDFYCPAASLCVEVDGEQHELRRDRDRERDAFLLERGIETLRIPSLWLFDDVLLRQAYEAVLNALERRTGQRANPW
jgi:very-short-patch-repair endonuclease